MIKMTMMKQLALLANYRVITLTSNQTCIMSTKAIRRSIDMFVCVFVHCVVVAADVIDGACFRGRGVVLDLRRTT